MPITYEMMVQETKKYLAHQVHDGVIPSDGERALEIMRERRDSFVTNVDILIAAVSRDPQYSFEAGKLITPVDQISPLCRYWLVEGVSATPRWAAHAGGAWIDALLTPELFPVLCEAVLKTPESCRIAGTKWSEKRYEALTPEDAVQKVITSPHESYLAGVEWGFSRFDYACYKGLLECVAGSPAHRNMAIAGSPVHGIWSEERERALRRIIAKGIQGS